MNSQYIERDMPPLDSKARNRMDKRIQRMGLHLVAGGAVAAFIAPEGPGIAIASLACVAGGKALYDHFAGGVRLDNVLALVGGGAFVLALMRLL